MNGKGNNLALSLGCWDKAKTAGAQEGLWPSSVICAYGLLLLFSAQVQRRGTETRWIFVHICPHSQAEDAHCANCIAHFCATTD